MYINKIALTVCLWQLYTNKCLSEQEDIPEAWVRWRVGAGQRLVWTARHKCILRQYILPVVICQSQSCFPPTSRMFGSFATDAGTPDASPLPPSCQFCISWRDWVRHAEGAANCCSVYISYRPSAFASVLEILHMYSVLQGHT